MLGPAAAEQVAAAAEEAAQQAEAAAYTAAARARCELPGGSAARRHHSAELEGAGGGISRAGSCQPSQYESPAPVAAAPANAEISKEAQETLLQLSKALRRPGREGLQTQGSSNLASTMQGVNGELMMRAAADIDQHVHLQALAPPQGHMQLKASNAAAAIASMQMGETAPALPLARDDRRTGSPAVALFKPTPQRHGKQLSDLFILEQPIWEPHCVPNKGNFLSGGPSSAAPSKSMEPVARLISPFAKAPAVEPHIATNALQAHHGESAFSETGPAEGASTAYEACERIRAYRPQAAQTQRGAQHADGGWTVANMEAGWAAIPCLATRSTFPKNLRGAAHVAAARHRRHNSHACRARRAITVCC